MDLEEIRRRLSTMNLVAVAKKAEVSRDSLYRLMHGKGTPRYETVIKVVAFLRKHAGDVNG